MNQVLEWKDCVERVAAAAAACQSGRYDLAETVLEDVIKKHNSQEDFKPAMSTMLENLSLVLVRQKRYARAERVLRRAITLTTNRQDTCRLHYKLAELYLFQGHFSLAEHTAELANWFGESDSNRNVQSEIQQRLRLTELWNQWSKCESASASYKEFLRLRHLNGDKN